MREIARAAAFCLLPVSLCAQWLSLKTPGIPRTPDGRPNLAAAAPRTSDGKPDLSGLWAPESNFYWVDLIHDIKDEGIFTPQARAIFQMRAAEYAVDSPASRCLPLGPGDIFFGQYRIMQSSTEVALLRAGVSGDTYRQIFMDGRELPKDPDPTWKGYSVGRWEGDTLVAETTGFNDTGWLDQMGHPRSEKLRVTERFLRVDFGHVQFQITFDDPQTFTKPFTLQLIMNYVPDTDVLEFVCNENERDRAHFVAGKPTSRIQLTPADLPKYTGTYEPGDTVISLINDQLYLWDIPIFPQTATRFDSRLAQIEVSLDSSGAVMGLTMVGAVGDEFKFVRKR